MGHRVGLLQVVFESPLHFESFPPEDFFFVDDFDFSLDLDLLSAAAAFL